MKIYSKLDEIGTLSKYINKLKDEMRDEKRNREEADTDYQNAVRKLEKGLEFTSYNDVVNSICWWQAWDDRKRDFSTADIFKLSPTSGKFKASKIFLADKKSKERSSSIGGPKKDKKVMELKATMKMWASGL